MRSLLMAQMNTNQLLETSIVVNSRTSMVRPEEIAVLNSLRRFVKTTNGSRNRNDQTMRCIRISRAGMERRVLK